MSCPECGSRACCESSEGPFPKDCPTRELDQDEVLSVYARSPEGELAAQAARVEAAGYGRLTRIEEIMDFAYRSGF